MRSQAREYMADRVLHARNITDCWCYPKTPGCCCGAYVAWLHAESLVYGQLGVAMQEKPMSLFGDQACEWGKQHEDNAVHDYVHHHMPDGYVLLEVRVTL